MAWTARPDDEKKEYFDSEVVLEHKASVVAEWIKESKHMIVFTGAGISTAAGIPDFRSGMDTKVETGPGAWELRAQGKQRDSKIRTVSTMKAIPTPTHMMFVKLYQEGLLKAVVSQNCDGLHRRSGLPTTALFELHGNSNVEKCQKCKREYLRDFGIRSQFFTHMTGRLCDDPACRGKLRDTIINFGETLPEDTLETSFEHAGKADLCLAMGSSLTVSPASYIPTTVGEKGQRLVIVNLQKTPLDHLSKLRVYAKCDDFTELVMSKLALDIPKFRLKRKLVLKTESADSATKVYVEGQDAEGLPFSFLREVHFGLDVDDPAVICQEEPFHWTLEQLGEETVAVNIRLVFQANYGEPNISLPLTVRRGHSGTVDVSLEYNPFTGEWKVQRSDDTAETLSEKMEAAKI